MSSWLIIFLLVIAVIALFILSKANKTYSSSITIVVNTPLEHAFKTAMDDRHMKEWLSSPQMSFESIENISGGEYEVGSKWKLTFLERGKRKIEIIETVTDFVENEHFGMDLDDKMFSFHSDMRFKADGDHTIITETQSRRGKSMLANVMLGLFKSQSQKMKQKMYHTLKEIIEREYKAKKI